MKNKSILVALSLISASSSFAASVPQGFTYQGKLMNAAGTAPLASVVSLKLDIYDPSAACLLYSETQTGIDLSQTNGLFAVQVGSGLADTPNKRTASVDQGLTMSQVFANNGQILASSTVGCSAGYTPTTGDGRLLRITVTNGGTTTTVTPDLKIGSVPNALVAETLQGQTPNQIFHSPTVSILTATSGTYTVPAGTKFLKIRMVGGGGGGGGGGGTGASSPVAATSGGATTFGASFLVANPGSTGLYGGAAAGGASSAAPSGLSYYLSVPGQYGSGGGVSTQSAGGSGGSSSFGGAGVGGVNGSAGYAASPNTGSGGGGSATGGSSWSGTGGGAGAYIEAVITSPSPSYSYSVGAGGTGSTSSPNGGNGGSGVIVVEAY